MYSYQPVVLIRTVVSNTITNAERYAGASSFTDHVVTPRDDVAVTSFFICVVYTGGAPINHDL